MKNRKWIIYAGIIALILIILGIGFFVYSNISFEKNYNLGEEYTPQQEITDEQLRQTVISLYYMNIETENLEKENRLIDSLELLKNPYNTIVENLLKEPNSENLVSVIPKGTILNKVQLNNNILYLDFSKNLIENQNLGKEQEERIIYSITNTLTELTEIEGIKILIDGEENLSFPDNEVNFEKVFYRNV